MKTVQITIEYDPETDSKEAHDFECCTVINGSYYHDCLKNICTILMTYGKHKNHKPKKLKPEQEEMLSDLRKQCAVYFRGIYHDKK